MTMALLKRHFLPVVFTLSGVGLLLIAGFSLSAWVGNNSYLDAREIVDEMGFAWWRAALYGLLLLCWPRLVSWITHNLQQSQQYLLSRRPLIILILLYECLLVQNPLSVILGGVA